MTYKILALDGGGFRGVMSAQILREVEQQLQQKYGPNTRLNDYFDLVAGTSTGSILASGIALGIGVDQLLKLYEDHGEKIFPQRIRSIRKFTNVSRGFFPVFLYPHTSGTEEGLANVLRQQLQAQPQAKLRPDYPGDRPVTIADIQKPVLLIPAYNTQNRRVDWFVSNNPKANSLWYDDKEPWQLSVCSASAPTFFSPYQLDNAITGQKETYIDGGVAVNNPALVALAHALFLPYKEPQSGSLELEDIAILSIGTGRPIDPISYQEVKSWGLAQWAMHLSDLFLPAPNDVNSAVCWQLIRGNHPENSKRVLRLDFALDSQKPEDRDLQTIDNPKLYQRFVDRANQYLTQGEVTLDINQNPITPKAAIQQFLEHNALEGS